MADLQNVLCKTIQGKMPFFCLFFYISEVLSFKGKTTIPNTTAFQAFKNV